jgi:hypothetical protein
MVQNHTAKSLIFTVILFRVFVMSFKQSKIQVWKGCNRKPFNLMLNIFVFAGLIFALITSSQK